MKATKVGASRDSSLLKVVREEYEIKEVNDSSHIPSVCDEYNEIFRSQNKAKDSSSKMLNSIGNPFHNSPKPP